MKNKNAKRGGSFGKRASYAAELNFTTPKIIPVDKLNFTKWGESGKSLESV